MNKLQFISINCRGLNTTEKRTKLYTWLSDCNFDIVLLQETHYIDKNTIAYNARWLGKSIHCYSDSPYSRGVSILFRNNLVHEILNIHKSIDGRKLLVNIKFDDKIITIVNIYAPNDINARCNFFKHMNVWIKKICRMSREHTHRW
jgi:exonuclease III